MSILKSFITILLLLISCVVCFSQGLNHNFLIGYTQGINPGTISKRGILSFTDTSMSISPDSFSMAFEGEQANISDQNGNLLMYTNGCQINDASHHLMQNGDSLNPSQFTSSWCATAYGGMPVNNAAVFLPWPGDSTRYILLHETDTDTNNLVCSELFYSVVDITQNGGLGAVIQKNSIALQAPICPGIAVCKHANGRDWWIVLLSSASDTIYQLLLTPNGFINMPSQVSGLQIPTYLAGTLLFSPDGEKFAYNHRSPSGNLARHRLHVFHFDRCSGLFSNLKSINTISPKDGLCIAFSPDSKYLYYGTYDTLFQVNTDTSNMASSRDPIAVNDYYSYPFPGAYTDFWFGYLAANGKIYVTSGNGVVDFHYINQPDSDGLACDMHLHGLRVPCLSGRGNVFHPNYYLGPLIGSPCDTLVHVGLYELSQIKNVSLYPNPTTGNFRVSYLLPQNQDGLLVIRDMLGKQLYKMHLPEWSTLQDLSLPFLKNGVYSLIIQSGNSVAMKRLMIVK